MLLDKQENRLTITSTSIPAIRRLLQDRKAVFERVRENTRSTHESCNSPLYPKTDEDAPVSSNSNSIFNSIIGDACFSFDDEIVNSTVYRNAIKRLASKVKANQRSGKSEKPHILDEPVAELQNFRRSHQVKDKSQDSKIQNQRPGRNDMGFIEKVTRKKGKASREKAKSTESKIVKCDDNISKSTTARRWPNVSLTDSGSAIAKRRSRRRLQSIDRGQNPEHDFLHTEPKFSEQAPLTEPRVEEIPPYGTQVPVTRIRWKSSTSSVPRSLESVESAIARSTIGNFRMVDREHACLDLMHQHPVFSQAPRSRKRRSSSKKLKNSPEETREN